MMTFGAAISPVKTRRLTLNDSPYAGRCFRLAEALEAALAVCNIGSENLLGIDFGDQKLNQVKRVELLLADQDLIKSIKVGWKILNTDVLLYVARALQNTLNRIGRKIIDRRQARKFTCLVAALEAQISAGKSWLLRPELDQLGDFLDSTTVMSLRALFNEFTILPTGIGEDEQTRKLPFISTISQV
jgi:hypothetical protein